MATRSYADVAPTAATIALNAYIYGYGGHSLVTPHQQLKQRWWTDERIDAKVTRSFVISKLRGEERDFLDRPLAFGEGLTDDTYMDWILDRAKRLFLILTEVGVPDQIFGCIDDSWDDDDLPLSLENVENLELSYKNDEVLNKKFYDMQFTFLLRELKQGSHIDYGSKEHIPMEHVNTLPPAVTLQPFDRIHFPGKPDEIFMRRKYSLVDKVTGDRHHDKYKRDIRKARALDHEHIASCWASYTSENAGFIISDFVAEHTLATYIEHRTPTQYMKVVASERPALLCEWMHCLSDALACLHSRGVAHTAIRPSNIWIDKDNTIAFGDVGSLSTFQRGKKAPKTEAYDYAAPESHISQTPITLKSSSPPVSSMSAFSRLRKMSTSTFTTIDTVSSSESSGASSTRSNSFVGGTTIGSPITSPTVSSRDGRCNSITTIRTPVTPALESEPRSPQSIRNFSRQFAETCPSPTVPTGPYPPPSIETASLLLSRPSIIDAATLCDLPRAVPEMSDIWSLGCIFLDILTFMIKGKNNEFIKFRSTRVTTKNRTRTDSSFHNEPDKIWAWIDLLEEESTRHGEQIYRGVPDLLRLIRSMMAQNATLRPTVRDVRDRIQEIMVGECGVEVLCCAGREWSEFSRGDLKDNISTASPRRGRNDSPLDADASIAMGMISLEPPRKGSDAGSRYNDNRQRGSVALEQRLNAAEQDALARTTSHFGSSAQRRRSSASTVTAKVSSWRSKFFSGGGGITA
ncbi:hypothetical protein CB0940_11663 [Cercospora beticola]|uniref:Protein kinase domain-containing protein n=1 Tax=Cercospora beticola TaxID=122368 RepID=A0A2G5IE11_CERBT|nr:hypothetical protein CB0940_11663 [Cercospora beticola]PIB02980.1 hypothetical protein CB0940_11663 [Cercospora beticola]WPB04016.1 hypothetical protein RHO25_008660 [Cercospora beticola]CAK1357192.1 unnamed protein product [Cercospora beticola]